MTHAPAEFQRFETLPGLGAKLQVLTATGMGAKGIRIDEPEDVPEGLAEALAHKEGPVVADAVVDPLALAMSSHSLSTPSRGSPSVSPRQVLSGRLDTVIKEIERNVGIV